MDLSPTAITQQAITAALSANWDQALELNKQLLELEPKNVDALNRLARAYFELGNFKESKKYFEKALSVDPYNQIASKLLKRIETCHKRGAKLTINSGAQVDSDLFIEQPGKTKVIALLKAAEPQKLSLLSPGAPVSLVDKNHCICAVDQNNSYLGVLPDDLSHHLRRLMKGGNKYQAFIKTIKLNGLTILIKEVFCSARFHNQPSFFDNLSSGPNTYSSNQILFQRDPDEEPSMESDEEESV